MRGNAQVRLHFLEHSNHWLSIQPVQRQSRSRVPPRLVGAIVEQSHQAGRSAYHLDIRLVVELLKYFAHVGEGVDVFHGAMAARQERLFECLCRADVSGAR